MNGKGHNFNIIMYIRTSNEQVTNHQQIQPTVYANTNVVTSNKQIGFFFFFFFFFLFHFMVLAEIAKYTFQRDVLVALTMPSPAGLHPTSHKNALKVETIFWYAKT